MFLFGSLGNFFKFFDQYGEPVRLMYKGENSYTTVIGGLLSLLINVLFLIIFIYLYIDLENKTNYTMTAFSNVDSSPPYFEFTPEKTLLDPVNYPDRAYFLHAFTFKNRKTGKYYKKEELDRFLFVEIYDSVNNKTSGKTAIVAQSELLPCEDVYKKQNFTKLYNTNIIKEALCINDTVVKVQGDYIDTIYQYKSIKITVCSYSNLPSKPQCANDAEIAEMKKHLTVTFLYSDYKLMPNIPDEFLLFFLNYFTVDVSNLTYQKYNIYLAKNKLKSYDNVYNQFTYFTTRPFIGVNKIIKQDSVPSKSFIAIYFRSDYYNVEYIRSYKTFLDFIGQLGGIWKVLFILGGLIAIPLNTKLLNMALANELYNLILPNDISKIDDYEAAERKSTFYEPYHLISSNGKNILEAKMTISYFKYQRSKGVYYSMGQTFCSVFLFCFRTPTMRNMDEIYFESKRRLFNQLNIADVLKFSVQFSIINKNTLEKNKILFDYQADSVINYEKYLKNQKLPEIEDYAEEELADLMEKDFLCGIRGLKNKVSGLDPKIDINLLKLFQSEEIEDKNSQTKSISDLFRHYFSEEAKFMNEKFIQNK
jgi:hypothetical protein